MAHIVNLQTRPDRLRKGQDEALRQVLLPFEDEIPGGVLREILTLIDRRSASRNKWTFVMLSPEQNLKVVDYLAANSTRPILAMKAWALCFHHLRTDTGEIMLHREELAQKLGTTSEHVSTIMSELVKFGAIIRRRQRVAGLRGPGLVQYFMNPRVATHLGGAERDKAQEDAPPLLRLIEGLP
jgi:CRP-like cAMP-binding protein